MSFPLGSLRGEPLADAGGAPVAWRQRLWLAAGGVLWLLALLALATHHPADAAFSTSGAGAPLRNLAGRLGAWSSDIAYFLFGFSAWWWLPVTARAWLSALARHLRQEPAPPLHPGTWVLAGPCCCWPPAVPSSGRACTVGARAARPRRWRAGLHPGAAVDALAGLCRVGRALDRGCW
jgi:hypothetical protein